MGAVSGAMGGSAIENSIAVSSVEAWNVPTTAYGARSVIQGYGGIGAIRGAEYPSSENKNINELPPKLQNNAQRVYRNELRRYLRENPVNYDPECGPAEISQYTTLTDGRYHFFYDKGLCINGQNVTAELRGNLENYVDISHTHPGAGGVPTGYRQSGAFLITRSVGSDMEMYRNAKGFSGSMHVYEIPTGSYFQFQPSPSNQYILDYWLVTEGKK